MAPELHQPDSVVCWLTSDTCPVAALFINLTLREVTAKKCINKRLETRKTQRIRILGVAVALPAPVPCFVFVLPKHPATL